MTSPVSPPSATRRRRRWPFGILAVAALRVLDATILAVTALSAGNLVLGGMPLIGADTTLTRVLDLSLAGLTIAGIVGLLLFRRWGWVLTLVLVGLALLGDLIRVAVGDPRHLSLLLHVVTAFYLNGRSVRALAGASLRREEQLDHRAVGR